MNAALFTALGAVFALTTCVWVASVRARDASLVDRFWGPGFALAAWTWVAAYGAWHPRALLVAALVTVWGARLGWHIARRNAGHGEDPRYAAMRAKSPASFWWTSFFTVFTLQAVLLWIVALPLWAVLREDAPRAFAPLDAAALALFALGFAFEVIGDAQLAAFKRDGANRGRISGTGGPGRGRCHPNYFGDATLWWASAFALATPDAWWTLAGPALMTFLLVRVSGAALLERSMRTRPGWAEYAGRTSAFFPLPPRR